ERVLFTRCAGERYVGLDHRTNDRHRVEFARFRRGVVRAPLEQDPGAPDQRGRPLRSLRPMPIRTLVASVSTVVCLALTSPSFAQSTTPTFELSAGYQFTHAPDQTFPFGLNVDGMRHYGPLGLVGEVGWARHSDDDSGATFTNNMWNFGVGPRWTGF